MTWFDFSDVVEFGSAIKVLTSALSRYCNGEEITWDQVTAGDSDYYKKQNIDDRSVNASNEFLVIVPTTGNQSTMAWIGVITAVMGAGGIVTIDMFDADELRVDDFSITKNTNKDKVNNKKCHVILFYPRRRLKATTM
jgi:hypothetical protein